MLGWFHCTFEQVSEKRESIYRLLAVLATGFDIRIVATGRTQHWLAREHREDLPGVSEWRKTHHPTEDQVERALEVLDPDGRKVELLRQLEDEPAQTLSRHALRALHDVDRSRISQLLREPVVPAVLEKNQTLLDAADSLLGSILPPDRYGDPDDLLGSVLFWPPNPSRLLEHPIVGPWMRLAAALTATEPTKDNQAVQIGPPLEQQSLPHITP